MARRLTAVLLLFAAHAATAQTTTGNTFTVRETNDQDRIINLAECNGAEADGLIFSWVYSGVITGVTGTYRLTISDQSGCPSTAHNQVYDNIDASSTNGGYPLTGNVNVPTLMGVLNVNCSGSATAVYFCVDYNPSSGATVTSAVTGTMTLDLARPPPPVVDTPSPGDSALNVSWAAGSGSSSSGTAGTSSSYDVVATSQVDPTDQHTKSVTGTTSTRVDGLSNGVTYDVVVYAFSPGGNQSDVSNTVSGTPVEILDFWRLYRAVGGREGGGCASGAGGLAALLALVPLALRRRRRS